MENSVVEAATTLLPMRVLVCGWIGSTNLGDELVLAGVRALMRRHDASVLAVSIDPEQTRAVHGVAAIDHRRFDLITRAGRQADLVVFGGGGLVQDETSPFNLPYHLGRVVPALAAGTPVIGLGLGIGPLSGLGRAEARLLRRFRGITVRDAASQALLAEVGVASRLGADTAWHLTAAQPLPAAAPPNTSQQAVNGAFDGNHRPVVEVEDVVTVSLRPWSGGGGWLPVGWRAAATTPEWLIPTLARSLDRVATRTGLPVRFVALQTDRDHALHREVAAAMDTPAELVVPHLDDVVARIGAGRLVIAMRYHAGIAATMCGRPSVLVGYSPKVDALATALGAGTRRVGFDRAELDGLDQRAVDLLATDGAPDAVTAARDRLVAGCLVNEQLVDRVVGAGAMRDG